MKRQFLSLSLLVAALLITVPAHARWGRGGAFAGGLLGGLALGGIAAAASAPYYGGYGYDPYYYDYYGYPTSRVVYAY